MNVARLALAVLTFLGIRGNSVLTLRHTDPPTTATVTHPTSEELSKQNPVQEGLRQPQPTPAFEEFSKTNPVLEALRQPPPILGTISDKVPISEPNSLFGTISAIGPQITERSATDDIVGVAVHRAQDTHR